MTGRMSRWALAWGLGVLGSAPLSTSAAQPAPNHAQQSSSVAEQEAQRSGRAANDASLATDLKQELADRVPEAAQIRVDANHGVVTLSGAVGSPAVKRRAVSIAQQTSGVTRVDDNLTVHPTP